MTKQSTLCCVVAGIPIIGLAGGIGSGKSHVARIFRELGCVVIDSDAQTHAAYRDPAVLEALRRWWGDGVFQPDGTVDRSAVARIVFSDPDQRHRLEALLHPIVAQARDRVMNEALGAAAIGTQPLAFVWDTPLLFEVGLQDACDAVVFVDAPLETRLDRLQKSRGWDPDELGRRENSQWPLDKKKKLSDDVVENVAEAEDVRIQVRQVLSRILSRLSCHPGL